MSDAPRPTDELLARVQRRLFAPVASVPVRRRYELTEKLGEGGMGVVWRAWDPALDRPLAVKVMRTASPEMHARLLAEGRALARLSHPHVVQIYEVDDSDGEVSLVMEYIRGQTLRAWAHGQAWSAVLRVCVAAGEGLAAAHAGGLAHRDFKPENVLVDDQGRAKVLDFGLARRLDDAPLMPRPDSLAPAPSGASPTLTRTGAVVGTPAYMAPEQAQGRGGGARADQFSYCVSVFEVLYGLRPHAGAGRQLRDDMDRGRVVTAPADSPVPPRIYAVLRRGLDPDPTRRWPEMSALLAALTVDPSQARARRRRLGALVVAAAMFGAWVSDGSSSAPCSGAADQLVGAWDPERRAALRQAIAATGAPFAGESANAVVAALDAYADRWTHGHTDACEATRVRGEQSEAQLDTRMRCLADRRLELRTMVDVLGQTDAAHAAAVVSAAQRLPDVDSCADPRALSSAAPPPPLELRADVARQRQRLAQVQALRDADRSREGYYLAEALRLAVRDVGDPSLVAEVDYQAGFLATRQAHNSAGEALLLRSYLAAERLGMSELARDAAGSLADNIGHAQERVAEGERWASVAEAKAQRLGHPVALGRVMAVRANMAAARGARAEALAYDREAVLQLARSLGPSHLDVAAVRTNLGISLAANGDRDGALAELRQALAAIESSLGPQHPSTAAIYNEFGKIAAQQRRFDEAREYFDHALTVWSRSLAPDHPDVALALRNLGATERRLGHRAQALQYLTRALAARESRLGATHSETISAVLALADLQSDQGRQGEALLGYTRVIAVREQKYGPGSVELVGPLLGLARVHEVRGELAQALHLAERAEAISRTHAHEGSREQLSDLLDRLRGEP
jgi:tetratricopeptide (TPR) repeat protein/predicted Ser/Thr protein kinase